MFDWCFCIDHNKKNHKMAIKSEPLILQQAVGSKVWVFLSLTVAMIRKFCISYYKKEQQGSRMALCRALCRYVLVLKSESIL